MQNHLSTCRAFFALGSIAAVASALGSGKAAAYEARLGGLAGSLAALLDPLAASPELGCVVRDSVAAADAWSEATGDLV